MSFSTVFGLAVLGFIMTSCYGYATKLTKGTDTSRSIQSLFSATFSLTCGLFGLIIFEITSIMDKSARSVLWRISLWSTFLAILVVIPLAQIALLVPDRFSSKQVHLGAIALLWFLYFAAFWILGGISSSFTASSPTLLESIMSRMGVFGTAVISMTSGFAAANVMLNHFYKPTQLEQQSSIKQKEIELASLTKATDELRLRISKSKPNDTDSSAGLFGNVFNRIGSTLYGSDVVRLVTDLSDKEVRVSRLRREIDGLELMQSQNDSRGSLYKIVDKAFAWYFAFRVLLSLYGSILTSSTTTDPVTTLFYLLTLLIKSDFDSSKWSQLISLVLAGAIIVTSVRFFMPIIMRFLEAFNEISMSNLGLLLLAQLMGSYFVATILMLKLTLPPEYRPTITDLFSGINLSFFGIWFDRIFLISVLISSAWIFFVGYHR